MYKVSTSITANRPYSEWLEPIGAARWRRTSHSSTTNAWVTRSCSKCYIITKSTASGDTHDDIKEQNSGRSTNRSSLYLANKEWAVKNWGIAIENAPDHQEWVIIMPNDDKAIKKWATILLLDCRTHPEAGKWARGRLGNDHSADIDCLNDESCKSKVDILQIVLYIML